MAGAKELKRRIQSVKNTSKITRTMEMVATAKSKRLVDRSNAARPYSQKISEMIANLSDLSKDIDSPYLRVEDKPEKVLLLVITANRGLCGGYNSNTLKMARNRIQFHEERGREVEVHVIGKKGISFFRFIKQAIAKSYTHIDESFGFETADELVKMYMNGFKEKDYDLFEVASTVYYSSALQKPEITLVMPVAGVAEGIEEKEEREEEKTGSPAMIFEPDPESILQKLIPHLVRTTFYRLLLEAVTSEQIARRIAMKSASDAAADMGRTYTRKYNRVRQAGITQEIGEIVSGADAIG